MRIGYFLSSEEFGPRELVRQAVLAERAGFHGVWISDHYHSEEMIGDSVPCGPDIDRHVAALKAFADAGFDELYVQQIGGRHEAFFETFAREVLPRFQ
jgi:alkanesulfonate monooxygenase SsuD/methylene tetrahydromethanopterin reductase-like flavin-dependent oxidoreductase (luciferase family)